MAEMTTDELLAAYAVGATSPGLSLLVASQMTISPETRERVAAYEQVSGACLAASEAPPMGDDALDDVFARIDALPCRDARAETTPRPVLPEPLPAPVIDAVGGADRLRWSFKLPGLSAIDLDVDGEDGERVQLLRARPGTRIPVHTHHGTEYTLVLSGALRDGNTVYRAGDVEIANAGHTHRPQVDGDETCYCLIVLDGSLKFTGRFGRALNYLGA